MKKKREKAGHKRDRVCRAKKGKGWEKSGREERNSQTERDRERKTLMGG